MVDHVARINSKRGRVDHVIQRSLMALVFIRPCYVQRVLNVFVCCSHTSASANSRDIYFVMFKININIKRISYNEKLLVMRGFYCIILV